MLRAKIPWGRGRLVCLVAALLPAISAGAANIHPDGLPLVDGDLSIAGRILRGDAHLLAVGDSILTDTVPSYLARWQPARTSGIVLGENLALGRFAFGPGSMPSVSSVTTRAWDSPVGPAGIAGGPPGYAAEFTFNGAATPPTDAFPQTLADRFYELGLGDDNAGHWANTAAGNLTLTALTYANPGGVAAGSASFGVRINDLSVPVATHALDQEHSATQKLVGDVVTFPAQAWNPGKTLAVDFRVNAGAAPAAGSNVSVAGLRISNGTSGFQLASIAQTGRKIEDYLDSAHMSDADLGSYVTLTDSNVALVQIGANDQGIDDGPTFQSRLQQLIDRYRAARPDMQFVLLSTYELPAFVGAEGGASRQVRFDQAMDEISKSNAGVMFLNLYDQAEGWDALNAAYLSDGVHPTAAGANYFADQTWSLITVADAAAAPEPTGLLALAGAFVLLASRRRARAA